MIIRLQPRFTKLNTLDSGLRRNDDLSFFYSYYLIPLLSHKLSLAIFILNGHQANNKNIILSQGAQGVQNLCFYRAYLILLGFLRSQRSLREISFFVFQVSLTSLTGIRGRNAVFMSPKPLISRKSSTINSYSSIDIILWDSSGIRSKVLQTNSYRLSTKKQRAKVKKELDLVSN